MSALISQEPVSGETILLDDLGSAEVASQVIESSRKNYATKFIKTKSKTKKSTKTKNSAPKDKPTVRLPDD